MSDQGNQHNNGLYQDQIVDDPSALCLSLWAKNRIRIWGGWGGGAFCVCFVFVPLCCCCLDGIESLLAVTDFKEMDDDDEVLLNVLRCQLTY